MEPPHAAEEAAAAAAAPGAGGGEGGGRGASPSTGLEGPMLRLGLDGGGGGGEEGEDGELGAGEEADARLPERPDKPDCVYYLRTGACGFGERCRYNHPRDRGGTEFGGGAKNGAAQDLPQRHGKPVCEYYSRTGTCKFGSNCKYHHPVPADWHMGRSPAVPGSYIPGSYTPMMLSSGMVPLQGWSPYPVVQTSEQESDDEDSSDKCMELNILELIVNGSEEPSHLDLALLQSITENFSKEKKIGSGGCGIVYKGILQNGIVAVKRLHNARTIKDKMFHREVTSLISVKHQNIVRFLGYCSFTEEHAIKYEGRIIMADIRERLLCFEYIRNGSLEKYLSDELRGLEWQTRYQIIIGICRGLHYLHKDKEIIHMDLKPGNILLDDLMVPKITDFGLSRSISDSHATTTLLISQGYVAPEYISRGKATSKSDIYSLGIIIIELVTGTRMKPNITKVLRRWNHRWLKSLKQPSLGYQQVAKCLELALRCIQDDPTDRPDISYIIDELNKIDTKDGQTQIQISPCCLEDILGIEPLEIHIPFEDLKISHSIELINNTDDYIAFVTKAKLECFCTEPNRGIVPPRSKSSVTLAMEERVNARPNQHYNEVITMLSTRVDDGALATTDMVTVGDMFIDSKEDKVDEVNVMIVFGKPQLPDD